MEETVKQEVRTNAQKCGIDPDVGEELYTIAEKLDGGYTLAEELPRRFPPESIVTAGNTPQDFWSYLGFYFRLNGRFYDAIAVYDSLYRHMMLFQQERHQRAHMSMPLCWMRDCFAALDYPVHAKRYLMYMLCEDAVGYAEQTNDRKRGLFPSGVASWHAGQIGGRVHPTGAFSSTSNSERRVGIPRGYWPTRMTGG